MEDLNQTLADLTALADRLNAETTRDDAVRPFARALYDLFVIRRDEPDSAGMAQIDGFLAQSAPLIGDALGAIDYQLSDRLETALRASWQDREWLDVCRLRSALEAVRDLYRPYLPVDDLIPEDEDLDAMLREKGEAEAFHDPAETPVTFPATHWWWGMT